MEGSHPLAGPPRGSPSQPGRKAELDAKADAGTRAHAEATVGQKRRPRADPDCRFCAIVAGRADAQVVATDPDVIAFLDSRPLYPGHLLVVPTDHYETLVELPRTTLPRLFEWVQRCTCAVTAAMSADGTFVALNNRVSQSVPHLHVHVVPRKYRDGLRGFFWPRQRYSSEAEAATVADAIRAALEQPGDAEAGTRTAGPQRESSRPD